MNWLERRRGHRPPPHDGRLGRGQEANAHQLDAELLDGLNQVLAVGALEHVRAGVLHAEHERHTRPADVGIHEAHAGAGAGQGNGQVGRDGALAHAALARGHGNNVAHAGQDVAVLAHGRHPRGQVDFHVRLLIHHRVDGAHAGVVNQLLERAGGRGGARP